MYYFHNVVGMQAAIDIMTTETAVTFLLVKMSIMLPIPINWVEHYEQLIWYHFQMIAILLIIYPNLDNMSEVSSNE